MEVTKRTKYLKRTKHLMCVDPHIKKTKVKADSNTTKKKKKLQESVNNSVRHVRANVTNRLSESDREGRFGIFTHD